MRKRVVNFFDEHRVVLIFLILILIVIIFLSINSYLFFHHEFESLTCTEEIDDEYCYHNDIKIFVNPEKSKEDFFTRYDDEIEKLIDDYHLDEFDFYTAYYYLVASRLNYDINSEYKILQDFLKLM